MTLRTLRLMQEEDRELVCSAAEHAYRSSKATGKPWPKVNIPELFDSLLESNDTVDDFMAVIVNEAFLVVCQKSEAWFSKDSYLQELVVMRIDAGSPARDAFEYLDEQAAQWGCKWIEFSTELSSNDEAASGLLHRAGYSRFGINHIKEIPNG